MISGRFEDERCVIDQIGQALNRAIEIRRRGVDKQKMLKRLGDELPAANERIAQDERGIVPDEIVPERRRVKSQDDQSQEKCGQDFFHDAIRLDRSNKMRV